MSFKRVGDDPSALRIQKKQRVSDLLLEDIPDDEAKLLKNGRFACVVCKHCPVFDTVAMLSIHRQGKKHLANAKVRLEKLKEDAELRQKREHLKYLETLGTDLSEEQAPLLKITQLKTERALQGSKQLIGCTKNETKPNNVPFFQSRKYITLNLSDVTTGDINRTESNILTNPGRGKPKQSFFQCKQTFNPPVTSITASVGKSTSKDPSETGSNSYSNKPSSSESGKLPNGTSDVKKVLIPSEKARREHFSRLRQAGWIMGLDGKWYKDENAEFDSDEDEPPPLPP